MQHSENTRVKIPCALHLVRLGYQYLSLAGATWDMESNIFTNIFFESIARLNPEMEARDIENFLADIKLTLDNEDLGRSFYEMLTARSGARLIDFDDFRNNSLHVVTELPYQNGDDAFRPDITLLINGLPLCFIEVKKPNNQDGILAERQRIIVRSRNKHFRRFINITQLMVFSNNMEYDDGSPDPIEGAFYACSSYDEPQLNYFREEEQLDLDMLLCEEDNTLEDAILLDNNLSVIKYSPEFIDNKSPHTPTHRICTSLFSPERLAYLLQYALVYVKGFDGPQKHIMRYSQFFATKAIARSLDSGVRKGIIWHTQGSGKTALAYYSTRFLTEYFRKQGIVPKFYFIVDRIDLLTQAQKEFVSRGLVVHTINSREDFARDIKTAKAVHNHAGKPEITVVNIQKFQDDPQVVQAKDYDLNMQRVYFLDEVHRSYNPKGSFLANLTTSDINAIKIGLTGTPLLGSDYTSRMLFGEYLHKYYYNASIADGYTLRLIREKIATNYKLALHEALASVELQQGSTDKNIVYAHTRFVDPLLDYILEDFVRSRKVFGDDSIGGMVICDSSEQAKKMYEMFQTKSSLSAALILYDVGTKDERKQWVEEFKAGTIDLLFVYNMLLTGFDAHRLKKLYLGRVIKAHNLLQALTRVNRPYKKFRYGYVVDFADISEEFEATNKRYFEELQGEWGNEEEHYSNLFKSQEEITQEIETIKDILFAYNTENAEEFCKQISQIQDHTTMLALKKALGDARALYNLIRLQGEYQFLEHVDFEKLQMLYREASNHLDLLNLKARLESGTADTNLLNIALEEVIFRFIKVGEAEMVLADKLKNTLRQTREALAGNFDQQDPHFITLKEELERLFKKKNLSEVTQEDMQANIGALTAIYEQIKELNRQNALLRDKYTGDAKYARIHKRLQERKTLPESERRVHEALMCLKWAADAKFLQNTSLLQNESYFAGTMMSLVIDQFKNQQNIPLTPHASHAINNLVVAEYMREFGSHTGAHPW